MGESMTMPVARCILGLSLVVSIVLGEEDEMPECPDGDLPCYTQTGHRLFDEKDYAGAVNWFELAGDHPPALDALGFAYETGQGKPKDPAQAFALYVVSANGGWSQAQFHLGNCYSRGVGTEKDEEAAASWFRKAADQGHASAAYNMGLRLYSGKGVAEDKAGAVEMFREAAEAGHTGAMYNVGV